jgi:hypothetical protein
MVEWFRVARAAEPHSSVVRFLAMVPPGMIAADAGREIPQAP